MQWSCAAPQVYGIDLALVSNLVSNPVVNETIVKLSGTASQVDTRIRNVLRCLLHRRRSLHHFESRPPSAAHSVQFS